VASPGPEVSSRLRVGAIRLAPAAVNRLQALYAPPWPVPADPVAGFTSTHGRHHSNIVFLNMLVAGVILKMATMCLLKMASAACASPRCIRLSGVARARLGRNFRAYHDERTGRRAPCAGDGSLIDEGHRAPSRTTICDDKHFILVALRSACGRLAVGTGHTDGAVTCDCRRRARRPRRTFRSLRPGRPWWPALNTHWSFRARCARPLISSSYCTLRPEPHIK
jgi:hypothetical protein